MVTEQIANLSAGNRRPGSNPGLSADVKASAKALAFLRFCRKDFGRGLSSRFGNTSSNNVGLICTPLNSSSNHCSWHLERNSSLEVTLGYLKHMARTELTADDMPVL